ncbi:glycosyltransferase family 2 protein [Amphritea sp. HPY]|uniref:glycosyltransferase family 2 protein n=1 Tax=Amphritea sp. HPY TaxID=3421652 RepID=UPI003D7CC5A4
MFDLEVSVIMPSYNSADHISASISSVLQQTFTDWELLIIDDCSSDNTAEVVKGFLQNSRIKLIQLEKNEGAAIARNVGIERSQGRYIAFLDSDDIWLPYKLETQLSFMKKNNVYFSYAAYKKIDEEGSFLGHVRVPDRVNYNSLLKSCVIGCLTVVYDTDFFGKIYMPKIRKRQDFGLWLKMLKRVDFAYGISEPLALYRVRVGSISHNKIIAAGYTWRLYREVEQLSLIKSIYFFSHYFVKGVVRLNFPRLAHKLNW